MAARNQVLALDILFAIFLVIGAGCLCTSGVLVLNTRAFTAGCQRSTGIVVRNAFAGSGRHAGTYPVIQFQANGETIEFVGKTSARPTPYSVNDQVSVLYVPANPHEARIDSIVELHLLALLFAFPGAIFLFLGGGWLMLRVLVHRRRSRIFTFGVRERARVIEIKVDKSVKVNQQHPWVLVAQFQDEVSNQTITCSSHYLWEDPSFRFPVGSEVTVYHLQDQPQKCAFQLDKPTEQA